MSRWRTRLLSKTGVSEVCGMPDDMFFLADRRSLRRGRRIAVRTETCRPCVIWPADEPEKRHNGVALDVSPHGMRVRMMDPLAEGQAVYVQMMRDEDFSVPLTDPMAARVVRSELDAEGFLDHGVQIIRQKLHREEQRLVPAVRKAPAPARTPRMYTLDIAVGERERAGRKRG